MHLTLVREMEETKVGGGSLALWWLGQSGFAVKGAGLTIYLDPYLSTRLERLTADSPRTRHVRLCPIPLAPGTITNADYVVCSHGHGDHLDPETLGPLAASSPGARFVVPRASVAGLVSLGLEPGRIITLTGDDTVDLGGIQLRGVPGKHNEFDWRAEHGYPYLGFLIRLSGLVVYHAGDTILYDGLARRLAPQGIDLALLPINGGDPERVARGFKSNMSYKEAADLGVATGARLVIPTHYGMFACNDERVERFMEYIGTAHPTQAYRVLTVGERFVLGP